MKNRDTDSVSINNLAYNLQSLEVLAWKKILNGSIKKKNGFRTMCVATINENKTPSLRVVVNRKSDEIQKIIYFHTDNRSRKHNDLLNDNRVSILFYDAKQRVQISVKAKANLHTNDLLANEKWRATSPQARLGYMSLNAPNTKSELPTFGYEDRFTKNKPTLEESNLFEENFCVVACKVYELEFLYLDFKGNRKANFYYQNGILQDCFWAVP